jgi:hypothetical protein
MHTVRVREKAGADGVLHLRVPVGRPGAEFEAVIVLESQPGVPTSTVPANGWPPDYFEKTFGSIDDETFERAPQGELPKPVEL